MAPNLHASANLNFMVLTLQRGDIHLLPKLPLKAPYESGIFTPVQKPVNNSGGDVPSLDQTIGNLGATRLSEV